MSAIASTFAQALPGDRTRSIWGLLGEKPGDNAQIEAVANATGLPWEKKRIQVVERWRVAKPAVAADISHIDVAASEGLEPPWPDMIITSGRRLMNAALWIKQRSPQTKLVLVGRPHGHFDAFDLIVAAPQFRLPPLPHVVNLDLPLLFPSRERIARETSTWQAEFKTLPRPLTAVLVGAAAIPFCFDRVVADELAQRSIALSQEGSCYFVTSRRTSAEIADAIAARLRPQDRLYRWQPEQPRNPYLALLGSADRFIVTGDSASMMVEVARLGKPLAICELPQDRRLVRWPGLLRQSAEKAARTLLGGKTAVAWLRPFGLFKARDLPSLHQALYRMGRAVSFPHPFPPAADIGADTELVQVGLRVRALLQGA